MKLKDIHETLLAVSGPGGVNDHTHRYDPGVESGETTVDEKHYHGYRRGQKNTSGLMEVPAKSGINPHEHSLPTEMIMGQDVGEDMQLDEIAAPAEKIVHYLNQLANSDLQRLTPNDAGVVDQLPKANTPLSITVEAADENDRNIRVRGLYWNTSKGTAIRTMQIKLEAMLEKLDAYAQYIVISNYSSFDQIDTDLPIPEEDRSGLSEVLVIVHPNSTKADLRSGGSGDHETGTG
jgi:hypothetical protein